MQEQSSVVPIFSYIKSVRVHGQCGAVGADAADALLIGERGKLRGLNVVGMKRSGIESEVIKAAQRAFMFIFKGKEGNFESRLQEARQKYQDNAMVMEQIKFIEEALSGRRNVMVAD